MPEQTHSRRTFLEAVTALLASVSLTATASGDRTSERSSEPNRPQGTVSDNSDPTTTDTSPPARTAHTSSPATARTAGTQTCPWQGLSGFYRGSVDRIVDSEHVVVLVESDGRVRRQFVVSADRHPDLGERDRVLVYLRRGRLVGIW